MLGRKRPRLGRSSVRLFARCRVVVRHATLRVGEGGLTRLAFGGSSCSGASALALLARNIFLPSLRSSRAERVNNKFDLNSCTRGVTRITASANSTCSAVRISFCLAKNLHARRTGIRIVLARGARTIRIPVRRAFRILS